MYVSTRGATGQFSAAEAIKAGMASDGGLFIPQSVVKMNIQQLQALVESSYQERALAILSQYLPDYTKDEVKDCINKAYNTIKFDCDEIAPLVSIDDDKYVLELWHGPTSAFKDMALQLLPHLLSHALAKTGETDEIVILVATSGDTGKAALEGFKDVDQTRIIVFYPQDGVSQIQRLQMITQEGENVAVSAVEGNFDDAQTGVKKIFNDDCYKQELAQRGFRLSSANSINWGRLLPQIVYYFSAYADLVKQQRVNLGQEVNFVVPTGNFGNILAGYYAKMMGLPIKKLICASNQNNVLTEFFKTGCYDRRRDFHKTISPSMDILISSNLERLLYHISGNNASLLSQWMNRLSSEGFYEIDDEYRAVIKELFWADWADDQATIQTIRKVYNEHNYLIDPHTAVAWQVGNTYQSQTGDQAPLVILSTASPFKFNDSVLEAICSTQDASIKTEFDMLDKIARITGLKVPQGLNGLKTATHRHSQSCAKDEMSQLVKVILFT
ncbi:Threonine synthase [bioreactor metagenome]|uniref:Threonine synthase n=1 Tax=bioreactor metagenome TaxID=1076179 RepID=A0A644TF33_9ZZZZ|nr:threonine synthase [Negativicutes bacterium]